MRRRAALLAVVVVCWAAVGVFLGSNRDVFRLNEAIETAARGDGDQSLEDVFVSYQQESSRTYDAYLYSWGGGEGVLRVLVFGDSYTSGAGLTDLSRVWPNLFAKRAATELGTSLEVVSVSRGGASMYTYARWLSSIKSGDVQDINPSPDAEEALRGEFDLIVIGYTHNDSIPLVNNGGDGGFDVVEVDPEEEGDVQNGSKVDPNADEFVSAVEKFQREAGSTPVLLLPVSYHYGSPQYIGPKRDVFDSAGFAVAATRNTDAARERFGTARLAVSVNDMHPGTAALSAIAVDAAEAVADMGLRPARKERLGRGGVTVVPHSIEVSNTVAGWRVDSMSIAARERERCSHSWGVVHGKAEVVCERDELPRAKAAGSPVPARYAPCLRFGAPYLTVRDERWVSISIRLVDSEGPVHIYALGYDSDGFQIHRKMGDLGNGEAISINFQDDEYGFAVVGTLAECPAGETSPPRVVLEVASNWTRDITR